MRNAIIFHSIRMPRTAYAKWHTAERMKYAMCVKHVDEFSHNFEYVNFSTHATQNSAPPPLPLSLSLFRFFLLLSSMLHNILKFSECTVRPTRSAKWCRYCHWCRCFVEAADSKNCVFKIKLR